ncbi:ictacalcin-like [Carassius gibelio]|uniref:ictacalcin-like n=1 Tax=Carassius gibelio TaxID=101364 RepID=UPI002278CA00|nr:ictacalcin-like [Carassius gibelio]
MSNLFRSMVTVIKVFYKYSEKEGDKKTLSKNELKELLINEMGPIFENASNPADLDKIFMALDADRNGTVDLNEYIIMVTSIIMLCEETFQKYK